MSIDRSESVIYLNTFTNSVSPAIRISYMVLPGRLLQEYREKLGFYSCTVPNFEQYILAEFIGHGYFEKHINRMRNYYRQKKDRLLDALKNSRLGDCVEVHGADAGLHFLITVRADCTQEELTERAERRGVRILSLERYEAGERYREGQLPCMVVNYPGLTDEQIDALPDLLLKAWEDVLRMP